jgi:hypothetical protein
MLRRIALSLLLCATAHLAAETVAQAPVAQINGYASWVMAFSNQQKKTNGLGGNPYVGVGAANLFFTAKGTSSGGLDYKFRCAMETSPGGKDGSYFTQNYIELADKWGTFQVGNLTGADDTMLESGLNLMGGANSIDGTFGSVVNSATGVIDGAFMYGSTKKATKLNYYTPTAGGFTLGVSWTPNTNNRGMDSKNNSTGSDHPYGNMSGIYPDKQYSAYGLNNVTVGMSYKQDFSTCNIALAAAYITENSRRGGYDWVVKSVENLYDNNLPFFNINKVNKTQSAQFTAAFGFDNWRFATGYINNFKSRLPKTDTFKAGNSGKAWNIAGQYTSGAYQFALGYFKTTRQLPRIPGNGGNLSNFKNYGNVHGKATSDTVSATVDFNALQGLKFFAEVDLFKMNTDANFARFMGNTKKYTSKNTTPVIKNSGGLLMFGTKVSF